MISQGSIIRVVNKKSGMPVSRSVHRDDNVLTSPFEFIKNHNDCNEKGGLK